MRRGFIQLAPLRKNEPPDYPCLDMNPDKVSQITHVWVPHTSEPGSRPVAWECLNEIKLKQNVGCRNPLAGRHRYRFRHVSIGQKLKLLFLVFIGKQCKICRPRGQPRGIFSADERCQKPWARTFFRLDFLFKEMKNN